MYLQIFREQKTGGTEETAKMGNRPIFQHQELLSP